MSQGNILSESNRLLQFLVKLWYNGIKELDWPLARALSFLTHTPVHLTPQPWASVADAGNLTFAN
jgi:hypothetical protein